MIPRCVEIRRHITSRSAPPHLHNVQDVTYLSSITVAQGKVYAMFVKSPTRSFKSNEDKYRSIVQSFRLL